MPAKPPAISNNIHARLAALGERIRAHRKSLGISATATAEAAGMSRVTLHRIEKGAPAVTIGAYMNAINALGLDFDLVDPAENGELQQPVNREGWIPARIRLTDYPQLKQLAWQVQGVDFLSPKEAWDIYRRNWRHLDEQALLTPEQQLIDALRQGFGEFDGRV